MNVYGFIDEGNEGYVYESQQANTVPLYRLRDSGSGAHFYTINGAERETLMNVYGFVDEGNEGYVYGSQQANTIPLYRLRGSGSGAHFYTINGAERETLMNVYGFVDEGNEGYVYEGLYYLPNGTYLRDNREISKIYQNNLPPHLNSNGGVQFGYDSNSFFVKGLFHVELNALPDVTANKFNAIDIAGWELPTDSELITINEYNLKVFPWIPPGVAIDLLKLQSEVDRLKVDSAILAYLLIEEPIETSAGNFMDDMYFDFSLQDAYGRYVEAYNVIRARDTPRSVFTLLSHNFWDLDFGEAWPEGWLTLGDFASTDPYGIGNPSDVYTRRSLNSVKYVLAGIDSVMKIMKDRDYERPYLAFLQAHNWRDEEGGVSRITWVMPTPGQLEAEIWGSIIHGATGYVLFSYHAASLPAFGLPDNQGISPAQETEAQWNTAGVVNNEISRFEHVLLYWTSTEDYNIYLASISGEEQVYKENPHPIHSLLKQYGRYKYLFVVNIANISVQVKIELPGSIISSVTEIRDSVAYTRRSVALASSNSFEDSFGPYEINVYEIE